MSGEYSYILHLTEEEALALAMASRSGVSRGNGLVPSVIVNIGHALIAGDPALARRQFALWERIGSPNYTELKDSGAPLDANGTTVK